MGAKKQFLKESEARIIIYLNNATNERKYVSMISAKLNIDYTYLMRLLKGLLARNWLKVHYFNNKSFYDINSHTPILTAKKVLSDGGQKRL